MKGERKAEEKTSSLLSFLSQIQLSGVTTNIINVVRVPHLSAMEVYIQISHFIHGHPKVPHTFRITKNCILRITWQRILVLNLTASGINSI